MEVIIHPPSGVLHKKLHVEVSESRYNPERRPSETLQQTSPHSVIGERCPESHVWMLLGDGKISATE